MNNLPKYYVIERDESDPRWKEYIRFLNREFGTSWVGAIDLYYGYDGCSNFSGTTYHNNLSYFENNPTLLTLDEFFELKDGFNPERGDVVEVSDNGENWVERVFLTIIEGAMYPCRVVHSADEQRFHDGEEFCITGYKHMRKIESQTKEEDTIDIKITVNGKEKSPNTFSKESWDNLRRL